MTLHLPSCFVSAPLLTALFIAQQAPRDAASATHTPSATAPAPPSQNPSISALQDGVPIKLRLLSKLDSHTAKDGDEIPFDVVNDVVVDGVTVLRRGATATGVVVQAKSSRTMGRAGKLSFTVNDIKLRNGARVPVRAFSRTNGENRTAEMIALMAEMPIASAPFFLLIHGTNTAFSRGTEITAFVNGDLRLDLASFDAAPTVDRAR